MRGFDSCYSCFMKKILTNSLRQKSPITLKLKKTLNNTSHLSRFNTNKKNYRPIFFKKNNLLLKSGYNQGIYNYIPYSTSSSLHNHPQLLYLRTGLRVMNSTSALMPEFYTNVLPFKDKLLNTPSLLNHKTVTNFNFKLPSVNLLDSLIDYYLSSYVLAKHHIHSKKAAIIIAQIIDSGHFSRRTVYLSNTQSISLKYKAKLTNYFLSYTPILSTINPLLTLTRIPLPLDFNFYPIKQETNTEKVKTNHTLVNFTSLETLLNNLLNLVWSYNKQPNSTNHFKFLKKYFTVRSRRFKKTNLINQYRNIFFIMKKYIRLNTQSRLNFVWQKKKMNWSSKRKLEMQFFNSFSKLPLKVKRLNSQVKSSLSISEKKISTFVPFNYNLLNLQLTPQSTNYNLVNSLIKTLPLTSIQLSLLYILHPWLLNTLIDTSSFKKNSTSLLQHFAIPVNLSYTNLQPHKSFNYITSKKILSLFSTNKIREDVIPMYYNTLVRFMEHCSGKKIFIQLYPFLNQNVAYDYIVRYKSWITRMKSYERRLGHKFFFEEALHIMHLSFTLRDATLFSSWLKAMILRISFWKTRTIFRFLRYLFLIYFVHIFPELQIKGLKIRLKGKISAAGNSRKRTILYRVGQTSHSKLNLRVSHSKQTINTFTGVMGFQVWLFY